MFYIDDAVIYCVLRRLISKVLNHGSAQTSRIRRSVKKYFFGYFLFLSSRKISENEENCLIKFLIILSLLEATLCCRYHHSPIKDRCFYNTSILWVAIEWTGHSPFIVNKRQLNSLFHIRYVCKESAELMFENIF